MPPRAKRKRASHPTADDSRATHHTRSSSSKAARVGEEEAPVLVPVEGSVMGSEMSKAFAVQRQRGFFLDITLAVGDTHVTAHKAVLAACSTYLEGLFTSGLAESSQAASSENPVVIRDVDGAAVAACVDCMYSGAIALSGGTVCAVIKAANLLGVDAIEEAACAFFVGKLEPGTALDALGFAEGMSAGGPHAQELHLQVLAYVHKHFTECAAAPAFVGLSSSSVAALLGSDELCVESEEVVLSALRRWYEHDAEGRAGALEELVPLVRFPLLPGGAQQRLLNEPLLVALNKLGSSTLIQVLLECLPSFKSMPAAAGCPRLKWRTGSGRVFTFASVDNTNARRAGGDDSGGRFDEAGVLHHIATEGGTSAYVNPHTAGRVVATRSSCVHGGGRDHYFVAGPCPGRSSTDSIPTSWMAVDLGAGRALTVNHYALRYGGNTGECVPRNWELQGSQDGAAWTTLRRHDNDTTMEQKGYVVAHWAVEGVTTPYRHFRVHQHGPNALICGPARGAKQHCLSCNGIELYGALTEA
jgi:hypothetical protein